MQTLCIYMKPICASHTYFSQRMCDTDGYFSLPTEPTDIIIPATSVMFPVGSTIATPPECVTVTGVPDLIAEGDEVGSVTIAPSAAYIANAPGGFTLTVTIEVVDNDGELNIRPVNLLEKGDCLLTLALVHAQRGLLQLVCLCVCVCPSARLSTVFLGNRGNSERETWKVGGMHGKLRFWSGEGRGSW